MLLLSFWLLLVLLLLSSSSLLSLLLLLLLLLSLLSFLVIAIITIAIFYVCYHWNKNIIALVIILTWHLIKFQLWFFCVFLLIHISSTTLPPFWGITMEIKLHSFLALSLPLHLEYFFFYLHYSSVFDCKFIWKSYGNFVYWVHFCDGERYLTQLLSSNKKYNSECRKNWNSYI